MIVLHKLSFPLVGVRVFTLEFVIFCIDIDVMLLSICGNTDLLSIFEGLLYIGPFNASSQSTFYNETHLSNPSQ